MISNRDRRKRKWDMRWFEFKSNCHATSFIIMFMGYWLFYVLFIGWRHYLFKPSSYVIKAGDIVADIDNHSSPYTRQHRLWWNKHNCAAACAAAIANESYDLVRFTERVHPLFLDQDILYVSSKGYKARYINDQVKLYSVTR